MFIQQVLIGCLSVPSAVCSRHYGYSNEQDKTALMELRILKGENTIDNKKQINE